jgi:hypothetical protein
MRNSSNVLVSFEQQTPTSKLIFHQMSLVPMLNQILNNKKNFLYESSIVPFDNSNWKHNPQLFCLDKYDDPNLYPIILSCNNLSSIYQFTSDQLRKGITMPKRDRVYSIINSII